MHREGCTIKFLNYSPISRRISVDSLGSLYTQARSLNAQTAKRDLTHYYMELKAMSMSTCAQTNYFASR